MAYRVVSADVESIVEYDSTTDLTPFIAAANNLVNNVCVPEGLDDATLLEIERWLAAHFYSVLRPQLASSGASLARDSYGLGKAGFVLSATIYGQQAMMLDYLGGLAKVSKDAEQGKLKIQAGATWLGVRGGLYFNTGSFHVDDTNTLRYTF